MKEVVVTTKTILQGDMTIRTTMSTGLMINIVQIFVSRGGVGKQVLNILKNLYYHKTLGHIDIIVIRTHMNFEEKY